MAEIKQDHILSVEALRRKLQYMVLTRVAEQSGVSYETLKRIKLRQTESVRTDTARKLTEFFGEM
jgi:hypothetical protein